LSSTRQAALNAEVNLVIAAYTASVSKIYMTSLLEYENQIFLDAFQDDGLLVMAK